jgi:penicillin-binding protein 2
MPGEVKGVVPNPLWKRRAGLGGWSTGDTYNMSIGQGFVTSTPLQVASFYQTLATRGRAYRPYLVDTVTDGAGHVMERSQARILREVKLKESTWDRVLKSLEGVVQSGTAGGTKIEYLDVRGKTGTAENPHGEAHAWFAGFAGYKGEPPRYAVAVFVENGGHGGVVSVPIARKLLEAALPPRSSDDVSSRPGQPQAGVVSTDAKPLLGGAPRAAEGVHP